MGLLMIPLRALLGIGLLRMLRPGLHRFSPSRLGLQERGDEGLDLAFGLLPEQRLGL